MNQKYATLGAERVRNRGRRRGVVLIAALACLFVIGLLSVSVTRAVLMRRASEQRAGDQQQAYWLATSALERAAVQLRRDRDYAGETWRIPAADLDGSRGGRVDIVVERLDGSADARRVVVRSSYPDHPVRRITVEKQLITNLTPAGDRS